MSYPIELLLTPNDTRLATLFGQHVLGQVVTLEGPNGGMITKTYSSFVCLIRGRWAILTAGHIIDAIKTDEKNGWKVVAWDVNDAFGAGRFMHTVPLGLTSGSFEVLFAGVGRADLAGVLIDNFHIATLQANHVVPVDLAADFKRLHGRPINRFYLVGMPEEKSRAAGSRVTASIVAAPVLPKDQQQVDATLLREGSAHRWYGQIEGHLGDAGLTSIVGMSGGPLMGIWFTEDDTAFEYSVIGVQSGWAARTGEIAAWKIDDIAADLARN